MRTPPISRASSLLFPSAKPTTPASVFDMNHWRYRWEREGGGLYGFAGDHGDCEAREQIGTNSVAVCSQSEPLNGPVSLQHKTNSAAAPPQSEVLNGPEVLQHATIPASTTLCRHVIRRPWDPESFGTHYKNRTFTLAVNGLSLERDWCDPDTLPPWAFPKECNGNLQSLGASIHGPTGVDRLTTRLGASNIIIKEVSEARDEAAPPNSTSGKKGKRTNVEVDDIVE